MLIILCIFIAVSFFELIFLFRSKNKKEAAVYIIMSAAAVFVALYIMLVPGYTSFTGFVFSLLGIKQQGGG